MTRPRWGIVVAGTIVFGLVASQILVPNFGERAIQQRLTEHGGTAQVTLESVPAFRLLFGDGERFEVHASDIDVDLDPGQQVLEQLDGFRTVDITMDNSKAGPIELQSFALHRDGNEPYELTAKGDTSANDLVDAGVNDIGMPAAGDLASIVTGLLGIDTDFAIPIDFDMQLVSDDGRLHVVSGGGTIAGVPTGSLAEMITNAIVVKL